MIRQSASEVMWSEFDQNRLRFLHLVSDQADLIATQHLTNENFHRLVKIAYEGNIVSAAELGKFGRRDPTTASRWINGHSAPDPFAQEAILKLIAIKAREQAEQLPSKFATTSHRRKTAPR